MGSETHSISFHRYTVGHYQPVAVAAVLAAVSEAYVVAVETVTFPVAAAVELAVAAVTVDVCVFVIAALAEQKFLSLLNGNKQLYCTTMSTR